MNDREIERRFKELREMIFKTDQRSSIYNDGQHEKDNELIKQNEDALIETDTATSNRITQIEDALIELDEQINGGANNG